MGSSLQDRLYRLAKRLSIGRVLRYGDLWGRYLWRRGLSFARARVRGSGRSSSEADAEALAATLANADMTAAKRLAVASWFPLDLANARLHRALLASVAEARADLGIGPDILDCLGRLKSADDLSTCVDDEVARGAATPALNTALYIFLLRRLPAPSELPMIASRHPRHALIAIQSGDEYRKQGRRILAAEPRA